MKITVNSNSVFRVESHSIRSLVDAGRTYLVTINDVTGALACWATRQSPYPCPDNLETVLNKFHASMIKDSAWENRGGLYMADFDFRGLERHLKDHLERIPEFVQWNDRKNGDDSPIKITSRYDGESDPDDDFICLDALYRNVAGLVFSEAEDFRLFNEDFERRHGKLEATASSVGTYVGLKLKRAHLRVGLAKYLPRSLSQDNMGVKFYDLAMLQRGTPELKMLSVQKVGGSSVLSRVVEDIGDLIHRMTVMAKYGRSGQEEVAPKIKRILAEMEAGYGFERDFTETIKQNFKRAGKNPERGFAKFRRVMGYFADAHEELPVYNYPQWLAKQACVAFGDFDFVSSVRWLKDLQRLAESEQKFAKYALVVLDTTGHYNPAKHGIGD